MLLASRGIQPLRAAARLLKQPKLKPPTSGHQAAAIHIPTSALHRVPASTTTSIQTARTALSRFLAQLIPSRGAIRPPPVARGLHTSTSASTTIRQSLSLPARFALGKPLGTPFMPRSPVLVSRNVANVGLGTARNFSSTRPVFQNLVQNVPVAARAFCEVDLNLGGKGDYAQRRSTRSSGVKKAVKKPTLKAKDVAVAPISSIDLVELTTAESQEHLESEQMLAYAHYFAAAPEEPFTTSLIIPLAPDGARAPLPSSTTLEVISNTHIAYSTHSVRVAALFRRLDAANVWERGARCVALDGMGDGLCRALCVTFDGWSEDTLRGVLGEAGQGWCEVYSVPKYRAQPQPVEQSTFIMPTMDFSSSFPLPEDISPSYAISHGGEEIEHHFGNGSDSAGFRSGTITPFSEYEGDVESDVGESDDSWVDSFPASSSPSVVMGFSSTFSSRL